MTYDDFKKNIKSANLTLREFADLIKANRNSITNLSTQESVPKNLYIISALLAEMAYHKIDYKIILNQMDIEPQKARVKDTFGEKKELR
jgi:hypothetical protein